MTDLLYAEALATFGRLLDEATASGIADPNAMALATADADGVPAVRTVLLKSFDERGFVFFTHFDSPKGRDLRPTRMPRCCSCGATCARPGCRRGSRAVWSGWAMRRPMRTSPAGRG